VSPNLTASRKSSESRAVNSQSRNKRRVFGPIVALHSLIRRELAESPIERYKAPPLPVALASRGRELSYILPHEELLDC
jgi:hypothetical protein